MRRRQCADRGCLGAWARGRHDAEETATDPSHREPTPLSLGPLPRGLTVGTGDWSLGDAWRPKPVGVGGGRRRLGALPPWAAGLSH